MNLSGEFLYNFKKDFELSNLNPNDILVIHDDLDMPLGKIRLKRKSGDGGHNGLKSIISYLKSNDFYRIKIGIGKPKNKQDIPDFVLSDFTEEEIAFINVAKIKAANKALILALTNDLNMAANFL